MNRTHKIALKTLLSIFFVFLLGFITTKQTHAGIANFIGKQMYQGVRDSFDADIRRTITDTAVTGTTELPSFLLIGRSVDQTQLCALQGVNKISGKNLAVPDEEAEGQEDVITQSMVENEDCSDVSYNLVAMDLGYPQDTPTRNKAGGGLVSGLYGMVGGIVHTEDIPVNLAYFAKDRMAKIPFVKDTAFAVGGPYDSDNTLWPAVLRVWEISKNISYGLLAIFMLYIGIMIMMRKKTDPRTAVTIQNALPKVVIAVILITFSYAIGAFAAEAVRGLSTLAYAPFEASQWGIASKPGLVQTFMSVASISMFRSGVVGGVLGTILSAVILVVLIFTSVLVLFKALVAYFKIILAIWFGPVIFAWGAIPGNEDATTNWFKSLAVNVITVPAMKLGVALSLWLSYEMLKGIQVAEDARQTDVWKIFGEGQAIGLGGSSLFSGVGVPLMLIVLLFWVLKIPNKLEEAILDKRK